MSDYYGAQRKAPAGSKWQHPLGGVLTVQSHALHHTATLGEPQATFGPEMVAIVTMVAGSGLDVRGAIDLVLLTTFEQVGGE